VEPLDHSIPMFCSLCSSEFRTNDPNPHICIICSSVVFRVGFTGTSQGMLQMQKDQVREYLNSYRVRFPQGWLEFRHGLCIGADEQAAAIAKELGWRVIAHPGFSPRNPDSRLFRSDFAGNDTVFSERPFIARDKDIVNATQEMIAAPLTAEEQIRSGTWTTVRYARKKKRKIHFALPPQELPKYEVPRY
jgi:hypothetical protein